MADSGPKLKRIPPSMIEIDADTQSRVKLDLEYVAELVEVIKAAREKKQEQPLPPMEAYEDSKGLYWPAEGWHRLTAWVKAEEPLVPCLVYKGEKRDAILHAAGSNLEHGLKRTNADKRRSVQIVLADEEWSAWSDRKIADHCGVGHQLVAEIRRNGAPSNVGQVDESPTSKRDTQQKSAEVSKSIRLGKDGKKHPSSKSADEANQEFSLAQSGAPSLAVQEPEEEAEGIDITQLAAPYRESIADLRKVRDRMRQVAKDEDVGGHLATKITRLESLLKDAYGLIHQAEPVVACPQCGGDGCHDCMRTGFWTRYVEHSHQRKS